MHDVTHNNEEIQFIANYKEVQIIHCPNHPNHNKNYIAAL